jgi:hypothetical protein
MKTQPPRLATRLLERFAPNEPLAGDLHEEYRAGRSSLWYWRQALTAVAIARTRGLSMHDVFAPQNMPMQVIMLGLVSVCAVFTVKVTLWMATHEEFRRTVADPAFAWVVLRLAVSFAVATLVGGAIARLHEDHRGLAAAAFAISTAVWSLVNLLLLNGHGNLDASWTHVLALLVFVCGLLTGGVHLHAPGTTGLGRSSHGALV